MSVRAVAAASLVVALACAAAAEAAHRRPPRDQASVKRGAALAAASCQACHSIGPQGDSPNRRAPPFRTIAGKYVPLTLHRRLTETAETGHFDMPPAPIHTDQVDDLAAYINSLGR